MGVKRGRRERKGDRGRRWGIGRGGQPSRPDLQRKHALPQLLLAPLVHDQSICPALPGPFHWKPRVSLLCFSQPTCLIIKDRCTSLLLPARDGVSTPAASVSLPALPCLTQLFDFYRGLRASHEEGP